MTTKHYQPGELLLVGKTTYKACQPLKQGDCRGCEFKHNNCEHNECHAPDGTGCKYCIFKKYTSPTDIDSPYELDMKGCRTGIIIIASAIGAALTAIGTAIYYSIII